MDRYGERTQRTRRRAADAHGVDQQRDADDALNRERGPSERMRLPHERDESAAAATSGEKMPDQQAVIGQAAADLAHGMRDTDCRNQPPAVDSPCPQPAPSPGRERGRATSATPSRLGRAGRRMRRAG